MAKVNPKDEVFTTSPRTHGKRVGINRVTLRISAIRERDKMSPQVFPETGLGTFELGVGHDLPAMVTTDVTLEEVRKVEMSWGNHRT